MIKKFNILFLNLFNIGKIKYAPGTFASLFTCIIFLILNSYISIFFIFLLTLITFFYSIFTINKSFEVFDSKDPQEIVVDEFVGQMIPLLAIPIYETLDPSPKVYYCIASFVVFRFFDILKPFPINYIDKNTKGALGIMFDDILAGIFTIIVLTVFFFFIGA